MSAEQKATVIPRTKPENIYLPEELKGNTTVLQVMGEILNLGYAVLDAAEGDARTQAGTRFDERIDELLDKPEGEFLLRGHPAWGVNWIGYLRHIIGTEVGGKPRLEARAHGRGVGDKSGRK
ncbi:hypothetical protein HZB58_02240 [Candidatus Gottesmanbacteria bacterium]|nr:hypothetical protein [Candidatus Gottesmanbacteria bacterium]